MLQSRSHSIGHIHIEIILQCFHSRSINLNYCITVFIIFVMSLVMNEKSGPQMTAVLFLTSSLLLLFLPPGTANNKSPG